MDDAIHNSLEEFSRRQKSRIKYYHRSQDELDNLSWDDIQSLKALGINCSTPSVTGNRALARLTNFSSINILTWLL